MHVDRLASQHRPHASTRCGALFHPASTADLHASFGSCLSKVCMTAWLVENLYLILCSNVYLLIACK